MLQRPFEEGGKTVGAVVDQHGRGGSVGHVVGPKRMVEMFGRRPTARTSCSSQIRRAVRHRLAQGKIDNTEQSSFSGISCEVLNAIQVRFQILNEAKTAPVF